MFANVGWGEMLVIVVVGLVILGPERLPGAIRWTTTTLRQARDYLTNATGALRDEIGPEFDDLRAPLNELQKLRGMTPRAVLTKHLLDGDESLFNAVSQLAEDPLAVPAQAPAQARLTPGTPAPFDVDAT